MVRRAEDVRRRIAEVVGSQVVAVEGQREGSRLIHGDVRSDNFLLVDGSDVVFVDWTSTCTGVGGLGETERNCIRSAS